MSLRHVTRLIIMSILIPAAGFGALSLPDSKVTEATQPGGAIVAFDVRVIAPDGDDGRTEFTVTCTPPSLSLFPLGTTTVNCLGSEGSTGSFPLTVIDTTPPTLTIPFDIVVVTTAASAVVTWTATASDLVDGSVPVACTPPSGSTFSAGTTVVSCTASDSHGNTKTDTFEVIVSSTPVDPDDITAEADGPAGANVVFDDSAAVDDSGRPIPGSCTPANGSLFPLGTTTVTCPNGTFTITVVDTTGPALELPETVSAVATTAAGVAVTYSATATDLVDGSVAVSCTPPSGSVFAVGTTTVNCTATDSRSNSSSGSFTVEVTTNLPDITAEATGPSGAMVTFDGTCSPASGSTFPIGATLVSCSVGVFQVFVVDTTPPALSLPGELVFEATSPAGAVATFSATATDIVDGSVAVVCSPPSGSTFALGEHSVICSATDSHNNTGTGSFTIRVVDTTPPALSLPGDFAAEATSAAGAAVTFSATASDLVDGSVAVTCTPPSGSLFPFGPTTVDCSATDSHNNTSTGSFTITVEDTTPPDILSLTVSPDILWPPDKKFRTVTVTANVSDAVDPAPIVRIFDITSNEPIAGDASITGLLTASLRAEREGNGDGDGRIYTLHIEAIDSFGNRSTSSVDVVVPHDQSGSSAAEPQSPSKRRSVRG